MIGYRRSALLLCLILLGLVLSLGVRHSEAQTEEKVSSPGEYSGYTSPEYESWTTSSEYVTMRDGVRLAVDIHMPAEGPQREKFPVILMMTPYHRANVLDGAGIPWIPSEAFYLSSYGYVVVVADIRGTGASFGFRSALYSPAEQLDGDDLVSWIVAQPWSDGEVGMMGSSYSATMELLTASSGNRALKCIVPMYSLFDLYDILYPGGLPYDSLVSQGELVTPLRDGNKTVPELGVWPSKPVDEDTDGSLLAQATAEHEKNFGGIQSPFRNSPFVTPEGAVLHYDDTSVAGKLKEIEDSGVPIYHIGGWFDVYTRDTLTMKATMSNPGKLLMGPTDHMQYSSEQFAVEYLRWFDWCLKGIDNGIDREPPYYIYTMGRDEWRFADEWPLAEQQLTRYYFGPGSAVTTMRPTEAAAFDEYLTDYTSTSGSGGRWLCVATGDCEFGDRAELDRKNLTYTTPPLNQDLEVTGHPVVHLFVSSTATDGAFFVYLEDIGENGVVHYVTEGELKASLRKLHPRPWKPDLPWARSYAEDETPLTPGQVEEMVFDLLPTSYVFLKGHRVRVSIAGWDDANFGGPKFAPPPTIRVYRDSIHASHVELPIIGEAADMPLQPASPPARIALPLTGSGGLLGEDDKMPSWWCALVAVGALLVAGSLGALARTRSRR